MDSGEGTGLGHHDEDRDLFFDGVENPHDARRHNSDVCEPPVEQSKNGRRSSFKLLDRLLHEGTEEEASTGQQLEECARSASKTSSDPVLEGEAKNAHSEGINLALKLTEVRERPSDLTWDPNTEDCDFAIEDAQPSFSAAENSPDVLYAAEDFLALEQASADLVQQTIKQALKTVSEHASNATATEVAVTVVAGEQDVEKTVNGCTDDAQSAGTTEARDTLQQQSEECTKAFTSEQQLSQTAAHEQSTSSPESEQEQRQAASASVLEFGTTEPAPIKELAVPILGIDEFNDFFLPTEPKQDEVTETLSEAKVESHIPPDNSTQSAALTTPVLEMGAGTSVGGEIEAPDPRFAAQSTAAMSTVSGGRAQALPQSPTNAKSSSRLSSMKSSGHMSKASRSNEGYEDAEVRISQDGFSQQEINVMEGQVVRFAADSSCPNSATVLQVINDGEELRPVIGGFQASLDDHQGVFQQQLNLEGEYKFALSGVRCTPLLVKVRRRTDLPVDITDEGFLPELMYIDQGATVKWSWKQTVVPHTVTEVTYVEEKGCLSRNAVSPGLFGTTTGTHRQTFNRPGLYFFRTEGSEPGKTHLCVVCVQSSPREYRMEVLDRSFQPMILLVEEGDRVWFSWDRLKCKKAHSVYQIEPPALDHSEDDPYEPVHDGFKWATPSKQGLMCHRFDKAGVFYFSDQNFEEAAEYIGTIIVKPKQREHIIKLQDNNFAPELVRAVTGERVWWTWDGQAAADAGQGVLLLEEEKVLTPSPRKNTSEQSEHYQDLDASGMRLLTRVGAATIYFSAVGTYTYRVTNAGDNFCACSILVNPGSKNHTVHLTDNGFEPKVLSVTCNDRVWWVWQSGKKQHNILQVSHRGLPIQGGFCSGQARDSPSAFVHQFSTPGVFYFMSKSLPEMFGAVVVSTRAQVHEVMVKDSEIRPDPACVQLDDVVVWLFGSPRQYDITLVETVDQVLDLGSNKPLAPRRCFAKKISRTGTFHYKSLSFQKKKEANFMDETRLSSVVCDERHDSIIVQVDKKGFHPSTVCLQKGQSLLWNWKGTEEDHNIIHVTDPNSTTPLNMIKGPRAFNSGRPLPNDSFLYTFDEEGSYTVISQGGPGFSCTVGVMDVAPRTKEPYISSEQTGGTVERYAKIYLACDTPGAKIYYTLDGSVPTTTSKVYNPEKGLRLRESGFHFVRAIAVAEQHLQSHIFSSKRFWVLSKGDVEQLSDESSVSDEESAFPKQTKSWDWLNCKPTIKGCFTAPGVLEVFWEPPDAVAQKQIKAYQIFLNGVSYCKKFPISNNSVKLVGLAGGRNYRVCVQVFPNEDNRQIVESNVLQMTSPKTVPSGGPLISLETISDPNTLCLVWMSISSDEVPITGYLVFLNEQQCGPKLVPDEESNRCKVVISGCDLDTEYKLHVLALLADSDETRLSNVLVVQLPLDVSSITLPPPEQRLVEEEVYLEYIEVLEGSGYLPEMDEKSSISSEFGSESESQSETSETASESEMELPRERQLKQQDAKSQVQHSGKSVDVEKAVTREDQAETEIPGEDLHPASAKQPDARLAQEETSGSESDAASSDLESDGLEQAGGGHVVILDASNNEATDTRENMQQHPASQRAQNKGTDLGQGILAVASQEGKGKNRKESKPAAMIKVLKEVELDKIRKENADTGDSLEKSGLALSPAEANMVTVREGEMVLGSGDGLLPAPSIMASTKGRHSVRIAWELPMQPDDDYKLLLYVVNVVGTKFSTDINSDISYECNLVEKGKSVRGVQHCWNIQDKQNCLVRGLQPGLTYRIYVIANYSMVHGNKPCEIQTTSSVLYYTTVGQPKAPRMRVISVDLFRTCLAWEAPEMHESARLKGYQINVDGKPLGGLRNPEIQKMVINNILPGRTISISVIAVMTLAAQESAPSKTIYITCPHKPPAPSISQQPSYKTGCVLIAWEKPFGLPETTQEAISSYVIYVDGQWHGEVRANRVGDSQGYQFFLTDLEPEQSYDVSVKAVAGDRRADPDAQHIYCLCESSMSNIVPVMAPAAPKSPKLRLEGLHPDGIDVTWQTPQQSGDAHISGYQMLRNGKLYGSIIPPDVNSLRIRDVSLGEKITLQLIALTEHPVGRGDYRTASGSILGDKDSGISGSITQPDERPVVSPGRESQKIITFTHHMHVRDWPTNDSDVFTGDRYSGCKPGQKLVVHYTGLVCPPSEVWCEQVTGHSALIVWKKAEDAKAHFVPADSYQVTWWPGGHPEDDINSDSTTDDHLLITNLRPAAVYTVVVEARKTEKYTVMDEGISTSDTPEGLNAFILSSKSEHLTVKTASPPDPPRNVGVMATTCNALSLAWDPPQEHGTEVVAIRVECISLNSLDPHHVTVDAMPDSTTADVTGLHEKTDYLVRVIAVTDEYFERLPDKHKHKRLRAIPRDVLVPQEESPWLPSVNIVAKTAGTEAPANLRLTHSSGTSITLSWTPPLVYGSNKLMSQIVRWRDVRRTKPSDPEDLIVASHVNLLPTEDKINIGDLVPGSQYEVVIEAVVSLKTSLNPDQWDSGIEKYRRTAHVMSKPLTVWTRAPIDPPKVLVVSYDQNTSNLYWEKPLLMSILGKDAEGNPRYLRRYLEGYRLEINGKLQSCLGPAAQTCTLTKCKPGKTYHVVLVAMTCTEDRHRERRDKFKEYYKTATPQDADFATLLEDALLDQAPSEPVEIMLPKPQEGFLETLEARFIHQEERDSHTFGDVEVSWTVQGNSSLLKQFSVVWFSSEDRVIQTKYVGPEKRRCMIPVKHLKAVYHMTVEPCYYTDVLPQQPQAIQIMVPGPPDSPEIFLRSQSDEELVVEWGEPVCYGGVKVKGYQVYMNDKKIGNELSNTHRKAVIPCRMNKTYRINLVALSANADYTDSGKSNTLVISSSKGQGSMALEEYPTTGDDDLPMKVTCVTESGIHLDWSSYIENADVAFYKIQWSSVAQPAQREVRLSPRDVSCVINKCLPGTTHFVRLIAFDEDGQMIEKSKQLTVQTSAPPDAPVLSVRACNFRYIAIQWEKPTTYGDALITGYKVYVNGIVEAILSADSQSFTYTQGKWCQEYSFQVQALTTASQLNSKPSEPLVLTWPGTNAPHLQRVPAVSSSSLRVAWDTPYLTEGVKIKHFKLCCMEEDPEKLVQSIGPIHPDTREAEFKHLQKGNYLVYLETHVFGTGEVVRSEAIRLQPAVSPDPPQISVTVVGLEERRQLEKLVCDLANKRDRLIRTVGHKLKRIGALTHPLRAEKDEDVLMGAHALTGVEELLEACFTAMENYTGQLIAHVSWQCPQSSEDVHVAGFKVLVDGKQYGSSMHAGVRSVRLQLGLDEPSYRLSMVSLSDRPQGTSVESDIVELLSAPFKPYAYYCYHNIHIKGAKWPSRGCCKYQDSLVYERKAGKKLANQGLLTKHVPPPACSLLDIFSGDYKSLMNGHRLQCPTVLLFWTPWCLSSQKIMDCYVRFARESSKEFNFVAVSCGVSATAADERQALVHQLTSNGWREDGVLWHCTSECASNVHRVLSTVGHTISSVRPEHDLLSEKYTDLTELLGIAGVPTFLFIHPEGYISWHGRYSSFDYSAFSAFLRHTNSEVMQLPCPVFNCDCCKNDTSIDEDVISALLPERGRTHSMAFTSRMSPESSESNLATVDSPRQEFKYVAINGITENANSTEKIFVTRRSSPHRKVKLSVNRRPYSASATPPQVQSSPYLAKVVNVSSPPSRSRSRPVSAKLVPYM